MNHDDHRKFIRDQLKAGEDSSRIVQQLESQGVDKREALHLVGSVSDEMLQVGPALGENRSLLFPVIGGLLSAVLGGGIWALIVIATQYEIGFMAWGIGALCGFAVLIFGKGQRGIPLQVIAVVSSLLGILIGKYGTFYYFLKEHISTEYGEEVGNNLSLFSGEMFEAFTTGIQEMVGGYDLLWIAFAVVTAWGIPKIASPSDGSSGDKPAEV